MGYYAEYLNRKLSFQDLSDERKRCLQEISRLRGGRDVVVYAADLSADEAPTSIDYSDLIAIQDQIQNLNGSAIDLVLETPGGSGEVAEDIVRALHDKYREVGVIIPGWAKSAGTLIAMAGDEILMAPGSALGPIDAQLYWQGKHFSAHALLEGMKKIREEVAQEGLNHAYIPILQAISPGELQSAQNALDFSKQLVREWLIRYKFKNWTVRETSGLPVTEEYKLERAMKIGNALCDHGRWLTHGRSIPIHDLEELGVRVTNYATNDELCEAIQRYATLLQIAFERTTIYKIFETYTSQIYRFFGQMVQKDDAVVQANRAQIAVDCPKCGSKHCVQLNFAPGLPTQEGCYSYPADDNFTCPDCGMIINLADVRQQAEAQIKKPAITSNGD